MSAILYSYLSPYIYSAIAYYFVSSVKDKAVSTAVSTGTGAVITGTGAVLSKSKDLVWSVITYPFKLV